MNTGVNLSRWRGLEPRRPNSFSKSMPNMRHTRVVSWQVFIQFVDVLAGSGRYGGACCGTWLLSGIWALKSCSSSEAGGSWTWERNFTRCADWTPVRMCVKLLSASTARAGVKWLFVVQGKSIPMNHDTPIDRCQGVDVPRGLAVFGR